MSKQTSCKCSEPLYFWFICIFLFLWSGGRKKCEDLGECGSILWFMVVTLHHDAAKLFNATLWPGREGGRGKEGG